MVKRKLSMFLIVFLVISQFFNVLSLSAEENDDGVIVIDSTNTYEQTKFYHENLFGIAGGFHLVGLNSVHTGAHVHGNILTNQLIYGSNFGTTGVEEVSYLKQIDNGSVIGATAHEDSVLVVGKDVVVNLVDNRNAWSINGKKVDKPSKSNSPNSLWQDGEEVFIDFNKVEEQTVNLVNKLSQLSNHAAGIDNEDHNKQEIIVSEANQFNVYNIEPNDFNFGTPIHIKGFNKDKVSTLIINVDMSKMENKKLFSIPNSVAHYTDGSNVSTGEVTEWSHANVVWNVFDSSNENNIYTGVIENSGAVTGSILSPGATANLAQNLNGTVIAKDIVVTGETHRDDYVNPDPATTEVAVEKVWEGKEQESVTINLLADGEPVDSVELSDDNNWKHTFTDLPLLDEETDEVITYTVEEVEIEGYETSITGDAQSGFTITNTEEEIIIDPETTEVSVEKVWEGKPKDLVTINLLADGNQVDSVESFLRCINFPV